MGAKDIKSTYPTAFRAVDVLTAPNAATVLNTYVKIGEYKVKAGETIAVGLGVSSSYADSIGRIYCKLMNGAVEQTGTLRLSAYDAQDHMIETLREFRTEQLDTNAADRTKQLPFPLVPTMISQDKKLVLEFKADVAGSVVQADSVIIMDITRGLTD